MKRTCFLGRIALAMAFATVAFAGATQAQAQKTITIRMLGIRIIDEDDPVSNDEPYLINVRFRARVQIAADLTASIVPNTLLVIQDGDAQNNLGRTDDNWADEVNTYRVTTQTDVLTVPSNEAGWIAGVVSVLMEEDGFSRTTANTLRNQIGSAVRGALSSLSFTSVDTRQITRVVAAKITRDINRAGANLNFGGIIRGLASGVDPDDFGGVNIVMVVTRPGDSVMMFAGAPPTSMATLPTLTAVPAGAGNQTTFSLEFPIGALGRVPSNARYNGKCRVGGSVTQGG
ncbi:MAG: hypothetical protein ACYC3X_28535 [Pirellulaceae bacterium]